MTTTTTRRWTPVTETTLQEDYDDMLDANAGRRWPDDWHVWRRKTINRNIAVIRATEKDDAR